MSISEKEAVRSGVVVDYHGDRPCIEPAALAEVLRRIEAKEGQ
jgi:CMP-2-keto-3-deoxyoctulosonic acid synthetase